MSNLSISLLGSFQATLNEESITQFRTKSVQALLAYLVCVAKRPFPSNSAQASSREQLMDLLWPGMPLKSAQANLRQTVYRLRQLIPEVQGQNGEPVPFLITNRQTIQINPEVACLADVHEFTVLIETEPEKAIALYRGDFLADFYLPDSETFEEWANNQRELYRRQVLAAMEQVTAVSIQHADYDKAIKLAQRQLEIDNLRESNHRQLMEAWARNGRRQEALTHYNHLQKLLQDEIALEPEPETLALIEAIRADELGRTITSPKSSQSGNDSKQPQHNLPQRLTSFIGREKEMAAVADLVSQNRLVMLTGVGGIGKTNLSLQVGRALIETFPDGVWLVELAPTSDANLIPQTIASALGLRDSAAHTIQETLLDYLQEKQCLLILDNCEHLINEVAQFVQTVLQHCADVKILASSREALAVPGERPFPVPPLTLPENGQQSILEEWQQYEALRLFVERAQIVLPEFQVTVNNVASLVQICQRLDGIPLALELAAARVKVLTTSQIAARLDDRFRLLTSGSRAALARQQTLRALIDWSWELLTEDEQHLLQRLSVFAGGMDIEAVETICADESLQSYEILDLLNGLVNKSLVNVQRKQGEETRYYLLETIRQYAQERLTAAGETETYRHKHLVYFRQLAATAEPLLQGFQQGVWRNRLEKELDNIRVALNWAHETDAIAGLELISSLFYFVITRGYLHEMETHLTQLIAQTAAISSIIKAKALWVLGSFLVTQSFQRREEAEVLWQESLALSYKLEDPLGITRILRLQGYFLSAQGQVEQGQALIREGVALMREVGDKAAIAETLNYLYEHEPWDNDEQRWAMLQETERLQREVGQLFLLVITLRRSGHLATLQGDFETARTFFAECLPIAESIGPRDVAYTLIEMGQLYFRMGEYSLAQTTLKRALSEIQKPEVYDNGEWAIVHLGYVHLRQGNLSQAKQNFSQSLQLFKKGDVVNGVCFTLEGLASLAVQLEQAEKATRLFAWADAIRKTLADARSSLEQADVDEDIAHILDMIDEETYTAVYAEGYAMTMEQAINYAIGDED